MFSCYLCEINTVYTTRFCDECNLIKRMLSVYGSSECLEILKNVCLRDKTQRNNKILIEKIDTENKDFKNI